MCFQSPPSSAAGSGKTLKALAVPLILAALILSCNGEKDSGGNQGYSAAVVRAEYQGADQAVFFDFSTGKTVEAPHDFFDIGLFVKGPDDSYIFANSGSYGSGVRVLDRKSVV
jgi:hypothetical protein